MPLRLATAATDAHFCVANLWSTGTSLFVLRTPSNLPFFNDPSNTNNNGKMGTDLIPHVDVSNKTNTFHPLNDWMLLKQGAEARIWKVPNYQSNQNVARAVRSDDSTTTTSTAVCKERFPKKYRHPDLDARLLKQRCRMEARILGKCKEKGINVPAVLQATSSLIYLEYIDGQTVRDYLEDVLLPQIELEKSETSECHVALCKIAQEIGTTISKLHDAGMVHGDLTTSNIMLRDLATGSDSTQRPNVVFIDFGLAKNTTAVEERAVDLYVLERALQSTHPTLPPSFNELLLSAYVQALQNEDNVTKTPLSKDLRRDTLQRLEKVRQRGRKRECFG